MKLLFALLFSTAVFGDDKFKDLRTYYDACGLVGAEDAKFADCNPPHLNQIMENFKRDPKNVETMRKISRFHQTHSLQEEAKTSLLTFKKTRKFPSATHFVLVCGKETSLDHGRVVDHLATVRKEIELLGVRDCSKATYAVGVVDVTGKPDVWMLDEKQGLKHVKRSTGKTPFLD